MSEEYSGNLSPLPSNARLNAH